MVTEKQHKTGITTNVKIVTKGLPDSETFFEFCAIPKVTFKMRAHEVKIDHDFYH